MMQRMFSWREIMQHKTMDDIFGKNPGSDATGE